MESKKLIKKCKQGERKAQKLFFDIYSNRLYYVACRYLKNRATSDDVLMKAFLKIFDALAFFEYKNEAALVGWLKRIVINEALMENRKNNLTMFKIELTDEFADEIPFTEDSFSDEDLMELVNNLPDGYRTVFMMYAVDGYSHNEIAVALNISESTSRSQFFKARKLLREKLLGKDEKVS